MPEYMEVKSQRALESRSVGLGIVEGHMALRVHILANRRQGTMDGPDGRHLITKIAARVPHEVEIEESAELAIARPAFYLRGTMNFMQIRPAHKEDASSIWRIIGPTIRAGETYALDREMPEGDALAYWLGNDRETFVAEDDGEIVGTYYIRAN